MKSRWIVPVLTAALLSSSSLALAAGGNLPFTDVPSGSWYREYVRAAWEDGLINGVAEHSFAPDGTLSLSQAVTLAARMHQLDQEGTVTLVNGEDIWYAPYVDYAEETGIIEREYYAGRWEETATRSEFIEIFYSVLPASEYTEINIVDDGAIPDVHPSQKATDRRYMRSIGREFCIRVPPSKSKERRRSAHLAGLICAVSLSGHRAGSFCGGMKGKICVFCMTVCRISGRGNFRKSCGTNTVPAESTKLSQVKMSETVGAALSTQDNGVSFVSLLRFL